MSRMYRQGDLLFKEVKKIPNGFKPTTNPVILRGEATGHSHRIENGKIHTRRLYYRRTEEMFIEIGKNGRIVHEEHKTLLLPQGFFQVVRQIEYTPLKIVNVMD